jgi:thiamine pyrophosphokinase
MRAVVFANGILEYPTMAADLLSSEDFIISADGGLRHIRDMGLVPHLLIGDLDSIGEEDLDWLQDRNVEIVKFPEEKDFTDLELALREAKKRGFNEIMIAAALGGRIDQTLANLSLLSLPELSGCRVWLDDGLNEVHMIRDALTIQGRAGDIVSLLPLYGPVPGVVTHDLKYPLKAETLSPGQTRGISNVMLSQQAGVEIEAGALLCIHTRRNVNEPETEEE